MVDFCGKLYRYKWVFPKIGVPQNGWFIMGNPMNKWMIWGFSHIFWVDTQIYHTLHESYGGFRGFGIFGAPKTGDETAGALNYDPETPLWPNRDRFVLSAGHLSPLLYGLLHVAGVKEMQELMGSMTGRVGTAVERGK